MPKSAPFEFTIYESRYAQGSAGGAPITWGYDYHAPGEGTFTEYVTSQQRFAERVLSKDFAPGIIHGRTNGYRSKEDTFSCTALVLDCDDGNGAPDLSLLDGIRYFYQLRPAAKKFHLVIPLADGLHTTDLAVNQIGARRTAGINFFGKLLGRTFDPSPANIAALLHPYTKRDVDDVTPLTIASDCAAHLDFETVLMSTGYIDPFPSRSRKDLPMSRQETTFASAVHQAINDLGHYVDAEPRGAGRCVICPFAELHSSDSPTSTVLTDRGAFICLHGHCIGRPQAEYYARLKIPVSAYGAAIQELLDAKVAKRVTVGEAHHQMRNVFIDTHPYESVAAVVRVTTGAGKTHAAADYLDSFTAPHFDEETGDVLPGRSAVLAVPTNALLREVDERLHVDHVVAQGVLAVLNEDGTPACAKYEAAKALQQAGGDVHRLMCARCEFKAGCPARALAKRGEGALTLTNHALLPSIADAMHEGGKLPLLVWDECPPMVSVSVLTYKNLEWILAAFEAEDTRRVGLAALEEPVIFGDRYRTCMRPLIEVLKRVRTERSLDMALESYGSTRLSGSQLHRAESMLAIVPVGGTWDRIRAIARAAERVNVSEMMFDALGSAAQAKVLRAEGICKTLDDLLERDAVVEPVLGGLQLTHLTPHGRLFQSRGGVVLDATAPVNILRALRPDLRLTDLSVRDDGDSVRLLKVQQGLSRRALAFAATDITRVETASGNVTRDIQRELHRFGKRLGRAPKAVAFTYKAFVDAFAEACPEVEWHYYGNTRGYDHWFQGGYDAFVTVGDPYNNIGSDAAVAEFLKIDAVALSDAQAEAEAAQAHGRSRSPQRKKADGVRLHLHYGRLVPFGWDAENCTLDLSYGRDLTAAEQVPT